MEASEYMNGHSYIKEYLAPGHRLSAAAILHHSDSRHNQGCGTGEIIKAAVNLAGRKVDTAAAGESNLSEGTNQERLIEYSRECVSNLKAPESNKKIKPGRILSKNSLRPSPGQPAGFSLLECLVSLSLSLLILIAALEVAVQARRVFVKLRESQEKNLAVAVALEKMREDLETAGAGIPGLLLGKGLTPLQLSGQTLVIFSADGKTSLLADVSPGQSYLLVQLSSEVSSILKKGRAVYLTDGNSGELTYIISVSVNSLAVSPALNTAFEAARTEVIVLEKIELYLDRQQKILRRRVNNTTGQPLLEEAEDFTALYQAENNLASIILSTESGGKAHEYELVMYPKNLSRL